ncbi:MAG: heme lyase CcmF/NrfE family subunit [Gammaproteobacteria bacterium]|nr:heme lyase CcmF/NrfE family subunit [Gammaproteobacteria bacterium]
MIAELGVYALCWALLLSVLLTVVPTVGLWKPQCSSWLKSIDLYVKGQFIFILLAYLCLSICFLRDDFTVLYVLSNSSVSLPWFYKLCAVWGGHEGSMLLWVAILSAWTLAVSSASSYLDDALRVRVLVVLGALSAGFILFVLMTSNPFLRQFTILHATGRDLNPLLQDPGFLFHPPILYMGYVGFAVAFAFAIAALWLGRMESKWAKGLRPWVMAAWCFLTLGITLGSWWAYRELGWGGWWFWDPVENASFMPWLAGTALMHALIVVEKRNQFVSWTVLLAIAAFSLSLVGTFLVRSGVLTSVHAFAVDPLRGAYILIFLAIVIGGSLLLFAWRGQRLAHQSLPSLISRDSFMLLNNVFLVVMMLTVLLGTVYPLLIDSLGLGKLSVGAPYFNRVFTLLGVPFLILMALGLHVHWQQDHTKRIFRALVWVIILGVVLSVLCLWKTMHVTTFLGLLLAFWVLLSTLEHIRKRLLRLKTGKKLSGAFLGTVTAHLGLAVTVIGITISTGYGVEDDIRMQPGDTATLVGYKIQFLQETVLKGPNYHGARVSFAISRGERRVVIYPEKRVYDVAKMPMTESAIDVTPFRDIYLALGEPLGEHAWSVRMYYKPFVRWIWGGGLMMFLGGLFALLDRRYYKEAAR